MNVLRHQILLVLIATLVACKKDRTDDDLPYKIDENYISQAIANKIATEFVLNSKKNKNKGFQVQSFTEEKTVASSIAIKGKDGLNSMYIINYDKGGFVIISADNRAPQVLAYSDKNNFRTDSTLSGINEWIYQTKSQIEKVRENKINVAKKTQTNNKIASVKPDTSCTDYYEEIGPLVQTQWGQGVGYNNAMPLLSCGPNGKAYTGCVATAMAQIIRYHQYPSSWYNYSVMQNKLQYSWDFTSSGANEIVALMQNASSALGSTSDCGGTGAYTSDVPNVFKNTFGYANSVSYMDYGSGGYVTVQNEIRAGRPIIMAGGTKSNWIIFPTYADGHAWVVDGFHEGFVCNPDGGYTGAGTFLYYHMNWGWNGQDDGWFAFHNFTNTNGSYNYQNKMVVGIHP